MCLSVCICGSFHSIRGSKKKTRKFRVSTLHLIAKQQNICVNLWFYKMKLESIKEGNWLRGVDLNH